MSTYKTRLSRRRFLTFASVSLASLGIGLPLQVTRAATTYLVGVGKHSDAYTATRRAVLQSRAWNPAVLAGKRVIIKPNLVCGEPANMGATTDPQVVRALVDLALDAGATQIQIVEAGSHGPFFDACGYRFFETYDPLGRVSLVDLEQQPASALAVPQGLAYKTIYLPTMLFGADVFYITVAKLKVHTLTQVTLSLKNQFGLPPISRYSSPTRTGRFGMHDRGLNQAVLDVNLARSCDFAVVDAMVGMERTGPWGGDPVPMNLVVAGNNALAVDHVCLDIMQVPLSKVLHMRYAVAYGLGPATLAAVQRNGDSYTPRAFVCPPQLPLVTVPRILPRRFNPSKGDQLKISFHVDLDCNILAQVVRYSSESTALDEVYRLQPWTAVVKGMQKLTWSGRDADGILIPPGYYAIRIGGYVAGINSIAFAFSQFELVV